MMKVYKASAGSGKTYTLAHTYINLLKDELSYRHILAVTFTNKATAEMKERILEYLAEDPAKRKQLTKILHDYSAFSISTIDKFFQQALKAFAREIGQVADYQVELERDSLIEEAMDRILDSLTGEDSQKEILEWIRQNVNANLEKGEKPNIERSLHEMGVRLKNDERRQLREQYGVGDKEFSRERLDTVRKNCRKIIKDFTAEVKAEALELPVYGKKHADSQREAYCKAVWYKPIDAPAKSLAKEADGTAFMELFGEKYRIYRTALLVEQQIFSLGLAREFFAQFDVLVREKNVLCLDDSNTLLKRIISGSEAPFVYEKLGVRYEHFLLDEFQDTSNIQWENFLPLLKESDSKGKESLIVGDVKQSIYRWRDSDWKLLSEKVEEEFPDAKVETKQDNYRSCKEVVDFNNGFFEFAAEQLGLGTLYSDVKQNVKSKDVQGGCVQVSFCDKDDEIGRVVDSIETALAANARFSDIAVLVRNNADGSAIAEELIERGYPVVSNDSLKVDASFIVRRLVSLLSCIENPSDDINKFIVKDTKVNIPSNYHSLTDLCEELLRQMQVLYPEAFENETLFIQSFMDELRERQADAGGGNLRYFLENWKEKERSINSPENSDAINILTIHKAKGLEFPYLIFPFAEKVNIYKPSKKWCWLDADNSPFDSAVSGIYSVNLSEKSRDTLFAKAYEDERKMQVVDNLNVFYVALTRAKCCLHIIADNPAKGRIKDGKVIEHKNLSDILYNFCGGFSEKSFGSMYDFSRLERKEGKGEENFEAEYVSIDLAGRLKASEDALDFFGEDGVSVKEDSPRRSGVVLHDIMADVKSLSDLEGAIKKVLLDGRLDSGQAQDAQALLFERIRSREEFFDGSGYNEVPIFDSHGNEYRPDKVVISGRKAKIIDYKFGAPDKKYEAQVRTYMRLYREMDYEEVEGYLWYVMPDTLVPVQ